MRIYIYLYVCAYKYVCTWLIRHRRKWLEIKQHRNDVVHMNVPLINCKPSKNKWIVYKQFAKRFYPSFWGSCKQANKMSSSIALTLEDKVQNKSKLSYWHRELASNPSIALWTNYKNNCYHFSQNFFTNDQCPGDSKERYKMPVHKSGSKQLLKIAMLSLWSYISKSWNELSTRNQSRSLKKKLIT